MSGSPIAELNGLIGRIGNAINAKNTIATRFKDSVKGRVNALNVTTAAILVKLQGLGTIGVNFKKKIDEQTREIADLNARLSAATNAQADAARQIGELTRDLAEAQAAGADIARLTRELAAAQAAASNCANEAQQLNQSIQAANKEIQNAIAALEAPLDDPELDRMLTELERQMGEINTQIDRIAPAASSGSSERRGGGRRKTLRKFKGGRRTREKRRSKCK